MATLHVFCITKQKICHPVDNLKIVKSQTFLILTFLNEFFEVGTFKTPRKSFPLWSYSACAFLSSVPDFTTPYFKRSFRKNILQIVKKIGKLYFSNIEYFLLPPSTSIASLMEARCSRRWNSFYISLPTSDAERSQTSPSGFLKPSCEPKHDTNETSVRCGSSSENSEAFPFPTFHSNN